MDGTMNSENAESPEGECVKQRQKEKKRKKQTKIIQWPSLSPNLNQIQMFWHDIKKADHGQKPSNVAELKHFCCKEERARLPPQ